MLRRITLAVVTVLALVLYLATVRAGAAYLPLNVAYTPGELDHFIRCVTIGAAPSPGIVDGRTALVLADAATRSAHGRERGGPLRGCRPSRFTRRATRARASSSPPASTRRRCRK